MACMAIHSTAAEMAIKKHKCQPDGGARGKPGDHQSQEKEPRMYQILQAIYPHIPEATVASQTWLEQGQGYFLKQSIEKKLQYCIYTINKKN